jgi:hypothetical protein
LLVEHESTLNNNPRLATVVGFLFHPRPPRPNPQTNMSKTAAKLNARKKPSPKGRRIGSAMAGSDLLVAALEREGVEVIFAYPGGASMEIHQALTKSTIRTILPRH